MMETPKPANIHTQFRKKKMAGILRRETISMQKTFVPSL